MYPTRNDLSLDIRQKITALLQVSLAEAIDLSLAFKHAHWNVKGPHFISLHTLFDDMHSNLNEHVDTLAERIVQLGGRAQGNAPAVVEHSKLKPYAPNAVSGTDHLTHLCEVVSAYAKTTRENIDKTAGIGDADTADILTGISRDLDKHVWFLEAHLFEK